jgi:hypothetical protein
MEHLYGFCITPPRDNVRLQLPEKNVVLPAGAPVLHHGTLWNPAKAHLDALEARDTATFVPPSERRRQLLSSCLKTSFTNASLSQGQEKIILKALSELQDQGLVNFEATVAKKPRTLLKWAAQGGMNSFVSKAKIIHIDAAGFLQGQASVQVITLNALDVTQALLLKEELRASHSRTGWTFSSTKPSRFGVSGVKPFSMSDGKKSLFGIEVGTESRRSS